MRRSLILGLILTVLTTSVANGQNWVPVYRRYLNLDPYHEHLYTTNITEASEPPWVDEDIEFYISTTSFGGSVPVYRLRKDGTPRLRLLTTNEVEKSNAIAVGYILESTLGYIYSSSNAASSEIHVVSKSSAGDRVYTKTLAEVSNLVNNHGYTRHSHLGYAPASIKPAVETRPATYIVETGAILNGRIVSDGGSGIIERRFDWGTTPDCSDGWTADVSVSGSYFSYYLAGLSNSSLVFVNFFTVPMVWMIL